MDFLPPSPIRRSSRPFVFPFQSRSGEICALARAQTSAQARPMRKEGMIDEERSRNTRKVPIKTSTH